MVTFEQLKLLEKYLDQAWKMLGIDVSFTKHFLERANDPRNGKPIDIRELQKLFVDAYKRYGSMFARMKLGDNEIEGVLTDLSTKINSPFVLSWDKRTREFDLRAKTVMRKNNFVPNNPRERKYTVEDRYSNSHAWSDYDRASGPTWTDWIAKKLGTKKWVVANQLTDKLKEKGYTVAISQAKYSELNKQFKSLHEEQERKQMSLNKRFGVSDEFAKIADGIAEEARKQRAEEAAALEEAKRAKLAELLGEQKPDGDEFLTRGYKHHANVDGHDVYHNGKTYLIQKNGKDYWNRLHPDKRLNLVKKAHSQWKTNEDVEQTNEAFDNGPGDKRAAEIKKELDADFNRKKTWKEKFKKFRQDLHYATNVSKLPKHLQDDVQEDVEQIDELSQDTLKSYIPKASKSLDKLQTKRNVAGSEYDKDLRSYEKRKEHEKLDNKVRTRSRGILNAIRKIPEDIEQVEEDCIKINIPLMIRLLEYAREDAKDDVALHKAVERMIEISEGGEKELKMADYKAIMEECEVLDEISKNTLMSYRSKADRDRMETWGKKEKTGNSLVKKKNAWWNATTSGHDKKADAIKVDFDKAKEKYKGLSKRIRKRADGIEKADSRLREIFRKERKQYE